MYLLLKKYFRTILALLVAAFSAYIGYNSSFKTIISDEEVEGVFSQRTLAQYDGVQQSKLYLALLGYVFDVTEGKIHYGKGGSYNYFVGKDGSRAFITGDFKDEGESKDHVLDLSCNDLFGLLGWVDTFKNKYIPVGFLRGRYYDGRGQKTEYTKQMDLRIEECYIEKEKALEEESKFPPCNIAWSMDEGSKVWCTNNSGGVKRSWAGVPRQLYTPGEDKPRCVCVNRDSTEMSANLKKYDNCPDDSPACIIENSRE